MIAEYVTQIDEGVMQKAIKQGIQGIYRLINCSIHFYRVNQLNKEVGGACWQCTHHTTAGLLQQAHADFGTFTQLKTRPQKPKDCNTPHTKLIECTKYLSLQPCLYQVKT